MRHLPDAEIANGGDGAEGKRQVCEQAVGQHDVRWTVVSDTVEEGAAGDFGPRHTDCAPCDDDACGSYEDEGAFFLPDAVLMGAQRALVCDPPPAPGRTSIQPSRCCLTRCWAARAFR